MTSLQELKLDLRRNRADEITAGIMRVIEKHVGNRADLSAIQSDLRQLLHEAGAEIVTDHMRHAAGLPPRGPDGWTVEELHQLEKMRILVMTRASQPVYFESDPVIPGQAPPDKQG